MDGSQQDKVGGLGWEGGGGGGDGGEGGTDWVGEWEEGV